MPLHRHHRPATLLASAALISIGWAGPAEAQEDYRAIVTIMRACSAIEDVAARVMCYDNNIRPHAETPTRAGTMPAPAANSTVRPAAPEPQQAPESSGFGSEMLPPAPREREAAEADRAIRAEVAAIELQEPGIYLVTLADGAQWRFVDAAPDAWYPPRRGDVVELERGSLGSIFLNYDGQRRLRVRRVR